MYLTRKTHDLLRNIFHEHCIFLLLSLGKVINKLLCIKKAAPFSRGAAFLLFPIRNGKVAIYLLSISFVVLCANLSNYAEDANLWVGLEVR